MSTKTRRYAIIFFTIVKSGCGVAAGATAFTEGYPILTVILMAVAAAANEVIPYFEPKNAQNAKNKELGV
jgi:hypothetical protein